MENYSNRSFTILEDQLPAMAGLVRHYQAATGDVPILGLWECSFHQDLLWVKLRGRADTAITSLPNITSWSWLSCSNSIVFDLWRSSLGKEEDMVTDDDAALIDWDVTWTSDPLVSSVKSTRLVINGLVHELRLSVVLAGSDSNPLYLKFEDGEANIANQPIP